MEFVRKVRLSLMHKGSGCAVLVTVAPHTDRVVIIVVVVIIVACAATTAFVAVS